MLQRVGSLTVVCELLVVACGIQFPDQESNSGPLHWEFGVLARGPPGKSQSDLKKKNPEKKIEVKFT